MDAPTTPFTFELPVDTRSTNDAPNKRPRTVGTSDLRGHLFEEERTAQRKQPNSQPPPPPPTTTVPRTELPIPRKAPKDMSLASALYDPGNFAGLPTATEENPHRWSTRRGEAPLLPINIDALGIPDETFPHAHVPEFRIFGNVDEAQIKRLRAITNPLVAIVIHGGGQDLNKSGAALQEAMTILLSKIAFPPSQAETQRMAVDGSLSGTETTADDPTSTSGADGSGDPTGPDDLVSNGLPTTKKPSPGVRIHLPIVRVPKKNNAFGQPWTWFADLGPNSEHLRKWLLYQEVFPISPSLSFSVHPITGVTVQPWTIMVLTGRDRYAVEDTREACQEVAKEIKSFLWADRDFTVRTARYVEQNWGLRGAPATLVKYMTDTIEVVYTIAELKTSRKEVPAYSVYAKPISNDPEAYLKWAAKFQEGVYWRGPCLLEVNKAAVECKLCKDTSHSTRACPLDVAGWKGTVVQDILTTQEIEARTAGTDTAERPQDGHDWQQARARRAEQGARPQKPGRQQQRNRRTMDNKGKGKDVRR
ncbi:hypothetical protein DICSQDRAFT_171681 [Dichomitus squalens LYAD-421 SS1]|uniref:Uncharacterized protein n=2 Tax=Dichomitus squalens TaxID=114155 RepID=A0A4Q9M336_9APHY|nr:uncharacterized protein DICSQDRAFT_171681 [Dichomitus squalens LYAD-421 SS1]EJF59960.1 hypothetical protein DICSQDRAFT_171681 [Dichomitus squalens LYAD-421 SS1]TBU21224.1 hypothetical protein BD311DRAFT_812522 [Dichomitus squalens]